MKLRTFVSDLRDERDAMLASYGASQPTTQVGVLIQQANLTDVQRQIVIAALDTALTDAFYTILLGLDGAASLGGTQQSYRLQDENGNTISNGGGELEVVAYEMFQDR